MLKLLACSTGTQARPNGNKIKTIIDKYELYCKIIRE